MLLEPFQTADEYLDHLAANGRCTRSELLAFLAKLRLRPGPCDGGDECGYAPHRGWQLYDSDPEECEPWPAD